MDAEKVVAGQGSTDMEERIGEGVDAVRQEVRDRLQEHRLDVVDAVSDFKDWAQARIDAMNTEPSGLWGVFDTAVDVAITVLTSACPPAGMVAGMVKEGVPAILAGSFKAKMLEGVKAVASGPSLDPKKAAKSQMVAFAQGMRDGLKNANEQLGAERLRVLETLSYTDDNLRELLAEKKNAPRIADAIGIPDAATANIYGQVVRRLYAAFAEWQADLEWEDDQWSAWDVTAGRVLPGSTQGRERSKRIGDARTGAGEQAEARITQRRGS